MHFKDQECLVEGPLTNLKQCQMSFPKPRKLTTERRYTAGDVPYEKPQTADGTRG